MTAVTVKIGRRPGGAQEEVKVRWSSSLTWMFTLSTRCARATRVTVTGTDLWRR